MAFIRWKHNGIGGRQAYLVHAYRGPDGKPKQKVLAYLGDSANLTPETLTALKAKYPDLKVNWDKVKSADRPTIDVSTLSDAELVRKIRHVRHELGLSQNYMVQHLRSHGMPPCSGPAGSEMSYPFSSDFGAMERALERGEAQPYYLSPETEIAPALRKALADSK